MNLFGNPLVKARPETSKTGTFPFTKIFGLDTLIELNKTEPYSIDFTPNGNYGDLFKPWDKWNGKISKSNWNAPYLNAIFIELDRYTLTTNAKWEAVKENDTGFETNEEYWEYIKEQCNAYKMTWSFVVESYKWRHLYFLIDPKEREELSNSVDVKDFLNLLKFVSNLFSWWDISAMALNKCMRVPLSNHWKTGEAIPTKIYWIDKQNNLTDFDIEKINYASAKWILNDIKYVKANSEVEEIDKQNKSQRDLADYSKVKSIPFPKLFNALEKYPKDWNYFVLKWNDIRIKTPEKLIQTRWYKYEPDKNYVNCFSDSNHDIDERPRWPVWPFLHYYFGRDQRKVSAFLKKEYGISVIGWTKTLADEKVLKEIVMTTYSVIFTTHRVLLTKTIISKGKEIVVTSDLFKMPIEVIGKIWEDNEKTFLIKEGEDVMFMRWYSSKRDFNKANPGMFCYAQWDDDLWLFMEALLNSDDIPKVEAIVKNWVYDDCVVLWGKVIYGHTDKYIVQNYKFELFEWKQIPVKDMYNKMCKLYEPFIIKPAFMWALALAWMNLWWKKQVYPALCLTGTTGSGKSVLYSMLKNMLGYYEKAREYAANAVSQKPLKEHATDNSILSLEEVTGQMSVRTEEIIRNIINHDEWAMGTPWQTLVYKLRSMVFWLWERTFKDESINNRFIMLVLHNSFLKGDAEKLQKIKGKCCTDDIYKTYLQNRDLINPLYDEYKKKIEGAGISWRAWDVWAYMFVMNHVFELGESFNNLIKIVKKNLWNMWFETKTVDIQPPVQLQWIIARWLMTKKVVWYEAEENNYIKFNLVFDQEFYQKNRWHIHFCSNFINESSDETKITILDWIMVMKYRLKNATKHDIVIKLIWDFISKMWKNAIVRHTQDYM